MAIAKTIPTQYQINAEYHSITSIVVNCLDLTATVRLEGWPSKTEFDTGAASITMSEFTFGIQDLPDAQAIWGAALLMLQTGILANELWIDGVQTL